MDTSREYDQGRTVSLQSLQPGNKGVISRDEFEKLDPADIEIYVIKPVKRISALLSHVVCFSLSFLIGVPLRDLCLENTKV
jgi:hypothetical protein